MNGEWPVLLNILGKGEDDGRYLSVAEVKTLFVDQRFPQRIAARLAHPLPMRSRAVPIVKTIASLLAAPAVVPVLAITQFPDQLPAILVAMPGQLSASLSQLLPPPLPEPLPIKAAHWLDQNWSTEGRHWFHHVSQGAKTFPIPYAWLVALEQPRIHVFSRPGLLSDRNYLERFGFIPSPRTIHADKATPVRRPPTTFLQSLTVALLGTSAAPAAPPG